MCGLVLIEATVFGCLIASYFYIRMDAPEWPPFGINPPQLLLPTISSLALFASSLPIHWADDAVERDDNKTLKWGLVAGLLLAILFLVLKFIEYSNVEYRWYSNNYGSIVWAIVGFHTTHVIALVLKTIIVLILAWRGYFTSERRLGVTIQGFYWHFVVIVWFPLYLVLYLAPRVL